MGCDGGTIPTRDEQVRTRQKPEKKDRNSEREMRWRRCHLTQEKLDRRHVVACQLGHLYNKTAIIEAILSRKTTGRSSEIINHIKSMKDVRDLKLTNNPVYRENRRLDDGDDDPDGASPWICPVTSTEMNGRLKFIYDWTDGRVMSERANKMLTKTKSSSDSGDVGQILDPNVVIINPDPDEEELMRFRMRNRREIKKRSIASKSDNERGEDNSKKMKEDRPTSSTRGDHSMGGKSAAKPRMVSTASSSSVNDSASTIQQDPNRSSVFKSLFSSHESAQKKESAHWVTFDPRYN